MPRQRGSRNKGYWFRKGRGWFVRGGKSEIALRDGSGRHIKNEADEEEAQKAYLAYSEKLKNPLTVANVCRRYLDSIRKGSPETYRLRASYLADLCEGYGERSAMILTRQDLTRWIKAHPGWKDGRVALQAARRALELLCGNRRDFREPNQGLENS